MPKEGQFGLGQAKPSVFTRLGAPRWLFTSRQGRDTLSTTRFFPHCLLALTFEKRWETGRKTGKNALNTGKLLPKYIVLEESMLPYTEMVPDGKSVSCRQELLLSRPTHQKDREWLLPAMQDPMQQFRQDQLEPQSRLLPFQNLAVRKQRHVVMGLMFFPRGGSAHVPHF